MLLRDALEQKLFVTSLLSRSPDDEHVVTDLEDLLLHADATVSSTFGVAGHNERGTACFGRPLVGYSIEAGLISVRPHGFNLFWIGDKDCSIGSPFQSERPKTPDETDTCRRLPARSRRWVQTPLLP